MIRGLLRKDWRLLRTYLLMLLVLNAASYAIVYFLMPTIEFEQGHTVRWVLTFGTGSLSAVVLSTPAIVMLAGGAFTIERMDRSAEFLTCLPPTRRHVLASKVIVVYGSVAAVVAVNAAVSYTAEQLTHHFDIQSETLNFDLFLRCAKIIVGITGAAWACSSVARSNGAPVALGLISPAIVASLLLTINYIFERSTDGEAFPMRFEDANLATGIAGFAIGCFCFLNRAEG